MIANLRDRLIGLFLPWFDARHRRRHRRRTSRGGDPIDFIIANNLYLVAGLACSASCCVLIGLFYLSWRFHTFRITGDDVEVRSGVLFRTHRRAPLDRVQGVNLTRPMFARLVGMAKLEVVGAGLDSNVKLEYLSTSNAEAVRADILRLASGARLAEAQADAPHGSATPRAHAAIGGGIRRQRGHQRTHRRSRGTGQRARVGRAHPGRPAHRLAAAEHVDVSGCS